MQIHHVLRYQTEKRARNVLFCLVATPAEEGRVGQILISTAHNAKHSVLSNFFITIMNDATTESIEKVFAYSPPDPLKRKKHPKITIDC